MKWLNNILSRYLKLFNAGTSVCNRTAEEWYIFYRRCHDKEKLCQEVNEALGETISIDETVEMDKLVLLILSTHVDDVMRCLAAIYIGCNKSLNSNETLIAALQDDSEAVRRTAALALVDIGLVGGLSAVVAGSHHGHAVRTHAAQRLREMGAQAESAIPSLMILLRDTHIGYPSHFAAIDALCAIGRPSLPILEYALQNGSLHLKKKVAIALEGWDIDHKSETCQSQ